MKEPSIRPVRKVINGSLPIATIPIRRSRAEAQRRQGVFDLVMGVGRVHVLIPTFFEGRGIRCLVFKAVEESRLGVSAFPIPPLRPSASARVLPISIRRSRAEAQRRQGVFDLVMGVGRVHVLIPTFFEGRGIRCLVFKAVAESRLGVSTFHFLLCAPAPLRESSPS